MPSCGLFHWKTSLRPSNTFLQDMYCMRVQRILVPPTWVPLFGTHFSYYIWCSKGSSHFFHLNSPHVSEFVTRWSLKSLKICLSVCPHQAVEDGQLEIIPHFYTKTWKNWLSNIRYSILPLIWMKWMYLNTGVRRNNGCVSSSLVWLVFEMTPLWWWMNSCSKAWVINNVPLFVWQWLVYFKATLVGSSSPSLQSGAS